MKQEIPSPGVASWLSIFILHGAHRARKFHFDL